MKRTVIIFVSVCFESSSSVVFTHHLNFEEWRYLGVISKRLAIGYGVTSLVAITVKHKFFCYHFGDFWPLFSFIGYRDGFNQSTTNIMARFDVWALGTSHMYHDGGMAFDPEGLLSTLPAVCHVMVGFYCGKLLFPLKIMTKRYSGCFGGNYTYIWFSFVELWLPINKKSVVAYFVITTCGLASSFLALLIWIIDIKGYQNWCVFFRSFGVNLLFIYVFAEIMGILLGATGASVFIYEKVLPGVAISAH